MRPIDADKLIYNDITDEHGDTYMIVHAPDIEDAPTLDIQPIVHAEWIEDEDCHRCSNCKAVLEEDYKWHNHNYCYHCGARMDKKEATYIKDIFMTR